MLRPLKHALRGLLPKKPAIADGDTFHLYRGDDLLGRIVLRASLCDFPWYGGDFEPEPAFAPLEPLFREELRLLDAEDMDAWGDVWKRIEDPALRLVPSHGGVLESGLLIHIRDGVAWWRP